MVEQKMNGFLEELGAGLLAPGFGGQQNPIGNLCLESIILSSIPISNDIPRPGIARISSKAANMNLHDHLALPHK